MRAVGRRPRPHTGAGAGHSAVRVNTHYPLWPSSPGYGCVRPPSSPRHRSFFTGDTELVLVPDVCIYRSAVKLVRFSYAYMLSLCLCDYFSRKLLAEFEFPYLKSRYVLFFHRKEFRRKNNSVSIGFLNRFTHLYLFGIKISNFYLRHIWLYYLRYINFRGTCNLRS